MHKNLILVVLVGSNKVCLTAWFGKFTLNVMKDAQFVFKFLDSNPFYETFAACTLHLADLYFDFQFSLVLHSMFCFGQFLDLPNVLPCVANMCFVCYFCNRIL